jgi:tRNA(Leu) C34 or U34 (ribose-2'-O)-methylase TrmL
MPGKFSAVHFKTSEGFLKRAAGRHPLVRPNEVHDAADARLRIPIREGLRSLNVAVAAGPAVGEALRQTGGMK